MSKSPVAPASAFHHALDAKPFERRAQAWHALAAVRAECARPDLRLFAGLRARQQQTEMLEHVPLHLLTPHPSHMD